MTNFAAMQDGIVVNIIWADTVEDAAAATGLTCIESTEESQAHIGWTHDGTTFVLPAVLESPSQENAVTSTPSE
jgi:hypothetical protein